MQRLLAASFLVAIFAGGAQAQQCGGPYIVQGGDSLSGIAVVQYKNAFQWTRIYQENLEVIGRDPDKILAGQTIDLPCLNGLPQVALSTGEPSDVASVEPEPTMAPLPIVLGAIEGMPPLSDAALPQGGLVTDLMRAAIRGAVPDQDVRVVSMRAQDALTVTETPVVSFPWVAPDCDAQPSVNLCAQTYLSAPVLEVLIVLHTLRDRAISVHDDGDMAGYILCRPAGYPVHMIDVELHDQVQFAPTPQACFDALLTGAVDAVVLNEFSGRAVAAAMGITGQITARVRAPIGISMIRAAIPKQTPGAQAAMDALNTGLISMRESGQMQATLNRHLKHPEDGS
ncbi:MAG: hypothetical protein AB8B47_00970 [Roseobacter sp.]